MLIGFDNLFHNGKPFLIVYLDGIEKHFGVMATAATSPKDPTVGSKGVFNIGPFLGTVYDVYFKHGIAIRNCKRIKITKNFIFI